MQYISIDVETTGLDPFRNQIIEFAAILEDTDKRVEIKNLPRFHCFIEHSTMNWDFGALKLNYGLVGVILDGGEPTVRRILAKDVAEEFRKWLVSVGIEKCFFAGKNAGSFDILFLKELMGWKENIKQYHRYLDVGPYYLDVRKHKVSPSLYECGQLIGLNQATHRAVDDAELVIALLREKFNANGAFNAKSI